MSNHVYCGECAHCHRRRHRLRSHATGLIANRVVYVCTAHVSIITGAQLEMYCDTARSTGKCGPRGLLFQPRNQETTNEQA